MCNAQVIRSKKCQNLSLGQNSSLGQTFLAAQFLSLFDTLLKLQQQILMRFCMFSYNSVINGFIVASDVIMYFPHDYQTIKLIAIQRVLL